MIMVVTSVKSCTQPMPLKAFIQVFGKSPKKGAFPHEYALLKVLYLRTKELENKWVGGRIQKWAMVMNQLLLHDQLKDRVLKYLE